MVKALITIITLLFASAGLIHAQSSTLTDGIQLLEAGDADGAIPYLERGLDQEPVPEGLYVALAAAYAQTGRYISLREITSQGLTHYPEQLTLKYFKAELLLQDGDATGALPLYQDLEVAFKNKTAPETIDEAQVLLRLGQAYRFLGGQTYQAGRKQEALQRFQRARSYMPDSLGVHHNVVILHLELEQWEAALDAADQSLSRFSRNEGLLRMKANALYNLERFAELEPVYETLYAIRPNDIEIGLVYAQVLRRNDRFEASNEIFQTLLTRFPNDRRIYDTLVGLNEQAMNYARAAEVLRQQRSRFPDDDQVLYRLAQTYEMQNAWDEARAAYDTLAALTGDAVQADLFIARTYVKQDTLSAALAAYRGLRARAPDNLDVIRDQAKLLRKNERWAEAEEAYSAWFAADSSAYARLRWGQAQEALGNMAAARTAYTEAVARGTSHPLAYSRLAVLTDDDSASCTLAEAGLRNALRSVKQAQEATFGQVQSTNLSDLEDQATTQELMDEYNQVGEQAFEQYTRRCPIQEVEPVLDELLKANPGSGKLHYLYGRHYQRQGDLPKARFHYTESAQFLPQLLENQVALAELNDMEGKPVQAIIGFERVVTLDPHFADAYQALIRLYTAHNQLERLADKWQPRYQATPGNRVLREHLIEVLRRLGRSDDAMQIEQQRLPE